MKVYYAHCMSMYNTKAEARDVQLLQRLGFEVENPNDQLHKQNVSRMRDGEQKMDYFTKVVSKCDALAFRPLPDGSISAGVANELKTASMCNLPVFEIPRALGRRELTVEQTREYLRDCGSR